ncbi:YacL family protein [Thorsellia kenyensis]|uniref:YacL family protein n=1 Tax=Thorsellia kenyensis TaxID=1549888 RepID=A0ABV6CD71_9GAMM
MEYAFQQINQAGDIEVVNIFENEAFKHWLNTELASNVNSTKQWISTIKELLQDRIVEQKWIGKEFTLFLSNCEIKVMANFLFSDLSELEMMTLKDENLSIEENEFQGVTDILDFYGLLLHYYEFMCSTYGIRNECNLSHR